MFASHNPKIASIIPTIQALITILGSCQPLTKNVLCSGARGSIGLPNLFQPYICIADETTSIINIPPITVKAITFPVKRPIKPSVAPKLIAPASPSQTLAGYTLKYKKAIKLPDQIDIKIESGVSRLPAAIMLKAKRQIRRSPEASPSKPSVILKAFEKATITKVAKSI